MATFNSIEALEQHLLKQMNGAMMKAQEEIYQIINRFVKQYYVDYTPMEYHRTYQLYRSLVKSEIITTNNGVYSHVYFDVDALDYSVKYLNGKWIPNKGWSEQKTLDAAAHGSHGGFVNGKNSIWDDPIKILDKKANAILKQMLLDAGIPIKSKR